MSMNFEKLNDEVLGQVAGGMTREMKAAYDVMDGKYGNGQARIDALRRAGYDPKTIQSLVNDVLKYENVAKDVIDGKYGNGQARIIALRKAGYSYETIQNLVNHMLLK
jgi:Holliday junction resolvasome RuvABC DNA-binding subunit